MKKLTIYAFLTFVACLSAICQTSVALASDNHARSCCPERDILAHGARLHGANGMYFDSDDNLYVCSLVGRQIVRMNLHTGRIIETLGPDQGIESPEDLAFGPDGSPLMEPYRTSLLAWALTPLPFPMTAGFLWPWIL